VEGEQREGDGHGGWATLSGCSILITNLIPSKMRDLRDFYRFAVQRFALGRHP
jgi:hypothetical protein